MTATTTATESADRWRYGLLAIGMGLAVLLGGLALVVWKYKTAADAGSVLGTITGPVGAMVGAYFGVQVGSAGKDKADNNAAKAQDALNQEKDKSQALVAALPKETAEPILQRFM